eukprot:m.53082 g.53082  ORF g.53082 m.53082 type:complete len:343 (-) comp6733_c1_seq1:2391-3419(-)
MAEYARIVHDEDIFNHMLDTQMAHVPPHNFLAAQPHISHADHQRLADWMLEVCECFKAEKELFVVSMTVLDRFLVGKPNVPAHDLQLAGATALLIASKLIGPASFHVETLCNLIHTSFTAESMKEAELDMLKVLNWSLEGHRPHDFLEMFLQRLTFPLSPIDKDRLRKHGEVFIDMCYTDANFVPFGPAVIAATALFCAACGVGTDGSQQWVAVPHEQIKNLLYLNRFFDAQRFRYIPRCVGAAQELFLSYDMVDSGTESVTSSPLCVQEAEAYAAVPVTRSPMASSAACKRERDSGDEDDGEEDIEVIHDRKRTRSSARKPHASRRACSGAVPSVLTPPRS